MSDDLLILDEAMAAMRRTSTVGLSEPFAEVDVTFHRQIVVASRHRRLISAWRMLSGIAYTLLSVTDVFGLTRDVVEVIQTHQAILDALRARDADLAAAELRRHL